MDISEVHILTRDAKPPTEAAVVGNQHFHCRNCGGKGCKFEIRFSCSKCKCVAASGSCVGWLDVLAQGAGGWDRMVSAS